MKRRRSHRSQSARGVARAMVRNLPNFLLLLVRLVRDVRVSKLDKAFFGFVIFYTLAPADLIPDVFGLLGLFDDVYLIGLALTRLLTRAGPDVLLEHWSGDPGDLGYLLERSGEVGGLLPRRISRTLRRVVRRTG
jgi:uncharacterized membrane protein YkvA (DUF1232 family)